MERLELNINSKYSGDSIVDIKELLKKAKELNLEGIAVTDFNDVNSFFKLEKEIRNYRDLDIIYGSKIKVKYYNLDIDVSILVKNRIGLKNLYRILTLINTKYLKENIILEEVFKYNEGLLFGINLLDKNIYELVDTLLDEDIYKFIQVFDYLILTPSMDHEYISHMVNIANKYMKLLVASSDVKYLDKEDKKYYEIFKENECEDKNYLMSTKEMLEEFNFLSKDDALKIVVNNPHKINLLVDTYIPLQADIETYNDIDNIKKLKQIIDLEVSKIYKNDIPKEVEERINYELSLIDDTNAYNLILNRELVKISKENKHVTFSRGNIASSFIAYLLGITNINPIEYNLNFDMFYEANKNKIFDISINYSKDVTSKLKKYLEDEFGCDNVIKCGTFSTYNSKIIDNKIVNYETKLNLKFTLNEKKIIHEKLKNIKKTNGKFMSYLVIPKSYGTVSFTPIIDLNDRTSLIDYHDLKESLIKINILTPTVNSILDELQDKMNIDSLDDKKVFDLLSNNNDDIPLFYETLSKNVLKIVKPKNIDELARTWALIHGTGTWLDNGEALIKNGINIKDIICFKDDIYNRYLDEGFSKEELLNLNKLKQKVSDENLNKISWLSNKSHSLEYALITYKLAYIKYYNSDIYKEVFKKYREEFDDIKDSEIIIYIKNHKDVTVKDLEKYFSLDKASAINYLNMKY